jgi:hypothetical protein
LIRGHGGVGKVVVAADVFLPLRRHSRQARKLSLDLERGVSKICRPRASGSTAIAPVSQQVWVSDAPP